MSLPSCPMCEMPDVLQLADHFECSTCGHEWPLTSASDAAAADGPPADRVVKDAYGNILADGDIVAMIKDLKLKGSSDVLKTGTKSKPIRLVDGDHEISCKMNGIAIGLKPASSKKSPPDLRDGAATPMALEKFSATKITKKHKEKALPWDQI